MTLYREMQFRNKAMFLVLLFSSLILLPEYSNAAPTISYGVVSGSSRSSSSCSAVSSWTDLTGGGSVSYSSLASSFSLDGNYQICVRAVEGGVTTYNLAEGPNGTFLTRDITSPSVDVSTPLPEIEEGTNDGSSLVSVNSTDSTGIKTTEYSLQNNPSVVCSSLSDYSSSAPLMSGSLAVGTYYVCVKVEDNAGNFAYRKSQAINVNEHQIFMVSFERNHSGSYTDESSVTYTATYSEPVIYTSSDISVTGGSLSSFQQNGSVYTFVVSPTKEGVVSIELLAADVEISQGVTLGSHNVGFSDSLEFYYTDDLYFYQREGHKRFAFKTGSCNRATNPAAPGFEKIRVDYDSQSYTVEGDVLLDCWNHGTKTYMHPFLLSDPPLPLSGSPVTVSYLNSSNEVISSRVFNNYGRLEVVSVTVSPLRAVDIVYNCSNRYMQASATNIELTSVILTADSSTPNIAPYTAVNVGQSCSGPQTSSFNLVLDDQFNSAEFVITGVYVGSESDPLVSMRTISPVFESGVLDLPALMGPEVSSISARLYNSGNGMVPKTFSLTYIHNKTAYVGEETYDLATADAFSFGSNLLPLAVKYDLTLPFGYLNAGVQQSSEYALVKFTLDSSNTNSCSTTYSLESPFFFVPNVYSCTIEWNISAISSFNEVVEGYLTASNFSAASYSGETFVLAIDTTLPVLGHLCDPYISSCIRNPLNPNSYDLDHKVNVSYTDINQNFVSFDTWITSVDSDNIKLAGGLHFSNNVTSDTRFSISIVESGTLGGAVVIDSCVTATSICTVDLTAINYFGINDRVRMSFIHQHTGVPFEHDSWVTHVNQSTGEVQFAGGVPSSAALAGANRLTIATWQKNHLGGAAFSECLTEGIEGTNYTVCRNVNESLQLQSFAVGNSVRVSFNGSTWDTTVFSSDQIPDALILNGANPNGNIQQSVDQFVTVEKLN